MELYSNRVSLTRSFLEQTCSVTQKVFKEGYCYEKIDTHLVSNNNI